MKIALLNNNYAHSKKAASKLKAHLRKNHTLSNLKPDIVIAIGGDGTFLRAVQKFWVKKKNTIFFAIHSGTLGFYSDFICSELELFLRHFESKRYEIESNEILELKIGSKKHYALNDIRVESTNKTVLMDVKINNKFLQTFRGNGLCFSTQSGSTAYNKSLGGAIMWPSTKGFQMTEVAPISNNAYSSIGASLIFSSKDKITLNGTFKNLFFTYDTEHKSLEGKKEIKISIAKNKVKIARFTKHYDFYKRLQDGFIK